MHHSNKGWMWQSNDETSCQINTAESKGTLSTFEIYLITRVLQENKEQTPERQIWTQVSLYLMFRHFLDVEMNKGFVFVLRHLLLKLRDKPKALRTFSVWRLNSFII